MQSAHLDRIQKLLWQARMEAASRRWHLENRAAPPLRSLGAEAGEPRLHQAAVHATKAAELFDAAGDALVAAIDLVEGCAPADDQDSQTT
ncbi:MAG TPA: hypothetical protein VGX25_09885 [Actinophytocola sp.]|uniref:hypothetical protein n=1 Tax=Actinophytocola sp. TaxID=1872138 RepID=UPI002DDD86E7|nr:hypothetical protein [Actinophytocola sp.]HEV2779698.1 hypothetical protein [Actinophytocola sp.]